MVNCSGGLRSTASPSTPACTGAGAPTSRRGALHARPGGWWGPSPGASSNDPEPAAVQRRPAASGERAIQRVGVVRHEHEGKVTVLASHVVNQPQRWHLCAWAEHLLGGLQECVRLGISIGGAADRVAVDPERDVVDKHPAIHFCHVDPTLEPVRRTHRARRSHRADPPQIAREVVAGPSRDADERKPMRGCYSGHDRHRPVAPGHAQRVGTIGHGSPGQSFQALARRKDDRLNPPFACPLGNLSACGPPPARSRVDKQHRPLRWIRGPPARTRQLRHHPPHSRATTIVRR